MTVSANDEPVNESFCTAYNSSKKEGDETTSAQVSDSTAPRVTPVPLTTPRHAKKQRLNRRIEVTDTSADRITVTDALQQHTREVLTVHNGPVVYEEQMIFHPYELYKHGKNKIHTGSVGYSSGADLVMLRDAVSEPSDADLAYVRRSAEIGSVICLDPKAQRPLTETEEEEQKKNKKRLAGAGYRKYPGIRAPKNRKVRNRLLNTYLATELGREILDNYREMQENGETDADQTPPLRPIFSDLPQVFYDILDLDEDAQTAALERYGVKIHPPAGNAQPKDPDSGEVRFQNLNSRLRGELVHAINSEFLSKQIEDLEQNFTAFIKSGDPSKSLTYRFRDGYGRLVCHGVAAYYKLVSQSHQQADGSKTTVVSWPKRKRKNTSSLTLPKITLKSLLRKKRNEMPHTPLQSSTLDTPLFDFNDGPTDMEPLDLGAAASNDANPDDWLQPLEPDGIMPVYQPFSLAYSIGNENSGTKQKGKKSKGTKTSN
ncbi:hypothetical protein, conserved [Trypanosoma brucei gambiense DAL972]|uniref:R3H-associated N-terminal domain-containing protein n=1 Tax=Trypanosoma brucei gambiense (strain MHOM/CI/86/DAL972) TaxID=679716 RepID=C9ZMS4_TRYB9|nr:hypothetical protein, conserved [Trypanosoma brucei gambiense DAL972]CBH10577.1 hypothetical protein, conserved [Trypanosoma brucei gambiense DAL972]|eukprot:XP_011772866.1 hypothetical protein, conserved [Trypanosoma brucei gambiense DAL972]